jgi:hypothetical protein
LPNCLHCYSGGIAIDNEDILDKKWVSCFYSKEPAFEGRQMLKDVLLQKKYKWDVNENNWMKNDAGNIFS